MPYITRTPTAIVDTAILPDVNARNTAYETALNAINGRCIRPATVSNNGLLSPYNVTTLTFWHIDPGALATGTVYAASNLRVFTGAAGVTSRYLSISFRADAFTTAGTARIRFQVSPPSDTFTIDLAALENSTVVSFDETGPYVAGTTITGKINNASFLANAAQLIQTSAVHSSTLTLTNACLQLFVQTPIYA
jgi:hypothetical protein